MKERESLGFLFLMDPQAQQESGDNVLGNYNRRLRERNKRHGLLRVVIHGFGNSRATPKTCKKYNGHAKRGEKIKSHQMLLKPEDAENEGEENQVQET